MAGGQLHQMNIEFQPIEDRLVLKINTTVLSAPSVLSKC